LSRALNKGVCRNKKYADARIYVEGFQKILIGHAG
jgi:hypothetical protein